MFLIAFLFENPLLSTFLLFYLSYNFFYYYSFVKWIFCSIYFLIWFMTFSCKYYYI